MNRTEFVDLTFLYNFYSLHYSVGRVLMIKFSMWSKGRGFDGSLNVSNGLSLVYSIVMYSCTSDNEVTR